MRPMVVVEHSTGQRSHGHPTVAMVLLWHPLTVAALGVLEEGGERQAVLLALLPWLVGRQGYWFSW
jgi:hypothetical protein